MNPELKLMLRIVIVALGFIIGTLLRIAALLKK